MLREGLADVVERGQHARARLLGGRYELRRRLGSGGMAEVYLATDLMLERDVVVKMLLAEHRGDAQAAERFRREGVALAAVHSPHVLCVHDIGTEAADMYLVLRYVRGRTLDDVVAAEGPLPVLRAAALVSQVLEGLGALHERRLVHRDVKSANVLVDWDDHVVLIDLGVVQNPRHPQLTPDCDTAGTPRFMAPEQRVYHVVDHRADLYQAGLLFLQLVIGADPNAVPSTPAELRPLADGLRETVATWLHHALADAPVDRFSSAGEMRNALERAVADVPDDEHYDAERAAPAIEKITARQRPLARASTPAPVPAPAPEAAASPAWGAIALVLLGVILAVAIAVLAITS